MNLVRWILIFLIMGIFSLGSFKLVKFNLELEKRTKELSEKLEKLERENNYLMSQIKYYQNPENLLKEARAQFNYHQIGENLVIIVPNVTSTESETSSRP